MKKLRWFVLFFVVVALFVIPYELWQRHKAKQREAAYQAALLPYTQQFKPGMTRKDVEARLQEKQVPFGQQCCVEDKSATSDVIPIGREPAPWFCSAQGVYIAFQFAASENHKPWEPFPSDLLKSVSIARRWEGCL